MAIEECKITGVQGHAETLVKGRNLLKLRGYLTPFAPHSVATQIIMDSNAK